jgi:hypothetical protein
MADIHIRNAWGSHSGSYNVAVSRMFGFMIREAFLAGKWQIVEEGSDTGWTNNILLNLSDAAVTVAAPLIVTSATGGFTSSHLGYLVTLISSNDDICGMYNIRRVIDSNTIELDERTRKQSWPADVGGITLRLHNAANTQPLGATYFVAQAPAAAPTDLQIYVTIESTTNLRFKAYPKGDYFGAATVTSQFSVDVNYNYKTRLNAYFADPAADQYYGFINYYQEGDIQFDYLSFGRFNDVVVGDTYPSFVHFCTGLDYLSFGGCAMYGLNELDVPISYYPAYYKRWSNDPDENKRESLAATKRINGGKNKVFRPVVVAQGDASGGFIRGTDPRSFCHSDLGTYDELGTEWWRMSQHALFPRDGAEDIRPTTNMTY